MPKKISIIESQIASTLIAAYFICRHCLVIDRNRQRSQAGFICPACGNESDSATFAFPTSIFVLVNMTQQSFHATSPFDIMPDEKAHNAATLIHFCTLREALINNFLTRHLRTKSIPEEIIKRLFEDNKMAQQKFGALFSSSVGTNWDDAVTSASKHGEGDYKSVSEFLKKASKMRNRLLHEAHVWELDRDLSEQCVENLVPLLGLFVALHNNYTHSLTLAKLQN